MKRYTQQIALSEIGISGQQQLSQARVLVIGVGGLGCPVLQILAATGVGYIGIVDGDVVQETNLHRQYLYTLSDCGKKKVEVAAEAILKQNSEVNISTYPYYFTKSNASKILSDFQIIVDCTDDLASRYLINDLALAKDIPMVYASLYKFEGQLSVFNYKNGPTYRCLFPESHSLETISNCNDSGVLGTLSTIIGTLQANEVLKIILKIGEVLSGKLLIYNGLDNTIQKIDFLRNKYEIEKGIQNGFDIINQRLVNQLNSLSVTEFFAEANKESNLVIDIRETYEEPKPNITNYKSVPLAELDYFLKEIDRNQKIILFCQNGNRSQLALSYMQNKGFTNLFHLSEGIVALEKKNV